MTLNTITLTQSGNKKASFAGGQTTQWPTEKVQIVHKTLPLKLTIKHYL
jgi:hypothetical protein